MASSSWAATLICVIGGITLNQFVSGNDVLGNLNIINSNDTTIQTFPWDVSFLVANNIWGAGAILSGNWILTTAFNCLWLAPSFMSVRAGSSNWTSGGEVFKVEKCYIHENYTGTWDYDIALLKLKGSITLNNSTTKTIIPAVNPVSKSVNNTNLRVSGWGVRTQELKKVNQLQSAIQEVMTDDDCKLKYNLTGTTHFCASNPGGLAGPCVYDFGAPLVNIKNGGRLLGLYIGSTDCTDPTNYPSLYVDVYQFKQWINETMTNNS